MDVYDEKWNSAIWRGFQYYASAGMGTAIKNIPYQSLGNLINSFKTFSETYIMPILEDSWDKFNNPTQASPLPINLPTTLKH